MWGLDSDSSEAPPSLVDAEGGTWSLSSDSGTESLETGAPRSLSPCRRLDRGLPRRGPGRPPRDGHRGLLVVPKRPVGRPKKQAAAEVGTAVGTCG